MNLRRLALSGAAIALPSLLFTAPADACGGFFCGRQPVDQSAERILFEVGEDSVTMTTQISFTGDAEDFAWVLPLSEVPEAGSLSVFPQRALNALDAGSGPSFRMPADSACYPQQVASECGGCMFSTASPVSLEESPVTVFVRAEVGEYDVAVIGSDDPQALVEWLAAEDYRITAAMDPYIRRYTEDGMKFLALKLLDTADAKDLSPFRFTLPGTTPSVPLRMTALAAEPEMSIVVFVLADQRFEGKNWENIEIDDDQITFDPISFGPSPTNNWAALVAQGVDAAGGQGWVTEYAGSSAPYAEPIRDQIERGSFNSDEDEEGARALLPALEAHPYLTRLYTRLSAEEMTSDPVFGRSALGDVAREHQLQRYVDGVDMCSEARREGSTNPCDYSTCGAAGQCRAVPVARARLDGAAPAGIVGDRAAACACLPGATARTTRGPDGEATVICQDGRLSFLNPGDQDADGTGTLPDPCATFRCGDRGQCAAMNMTPTCVCDQGYVAVGGFDGSGARVMRCVEPPEVVPASFYRRTLPALPEALPGGRAVTLTEPLPMLDATDPSAPPEPAPSFPMPRFNPDLPEEAPVPPSAGAGRASEGGCSVPASRSGGSGPLALLGLLLWAARRRSARR